MEQPGAQEGWSRLERAYPNLARAIAERDWLATWQEQRDAEQARRERIPADVQSIAASLNEAFAAAGIEYRVEPSEPTS